MSASNTIDFNTEYGVVDGQTELSAEEFNRRYLSFHQRINAIEVKGEGYDSLIEQGTAAALNRINDGVAPLLASLVSQIASAGAALGLLQAQLNSGITADQIKFSSGGGIAATNVRDAISELLADIMSGDANTFTQARKTRAKGLYFSNF